MTREVDPLDPAVLERINKVLEDEVAALMTTPAPVLTSEPAEVILDRIAEWAERFEALPKPPDKIKLTKAELEWLKAANPPLDRAPSLWDIPIELVEDPKESTLYRPPCCDKHGQHCEVPNAVCCESCPRAVELAELVAKHVPYVGFEPLEPRADQTRGWLARAIERWFG